MKYGILRLGFRFVRRPGTIHPGGRWWKWSLGFLVVASAGGVWADWWFALPEGAKASYVGRQSCLECHPSQAQKFAGSHHDLAMQPATESTVLGNFDNQTIDHFGVISRMYRDGSRFMVHTEGADGAMRDYQIQYVFGITPLQQYLVETERADDLHENQIGRMQVLPLCWDTNAKRWFYLSPPDVDQKLAPDDPLHWTQRGQNWNHMCAECHSTHLEKNFDLATGTYRTTFSEIDVSCEACHGPGSTHVKLATSRSLFWDRRHGYGLARLKSSDPDVQIHTCAVCHSRRSQRVSPEVRPGDSYYDHFANELIGPLIYYADGQPKEEAYVFGSFLQSRMYAKGVRCSDCHDPHTAGLKGSGNRVCTSCHAHPPWKYDTPAHHHHVAGSTGSQCVECHMPAAPFMDIDWRRDHSLRIPRPQLSVDLQTPNACSQCHIEDLSPPDEKKKELPHYWAWMRAAEAGDTQARRHLDELDRWAAQWCEKWYGKRRDTDQHFAHALAKAWKGDRTSVDRLEELSVHRSLPGIVRASTLFQLAQLDPDRASQVSLKLLSDADPQVRAVAVANTRPLARKLLIDYVVPKLNDPVRLVRLEAARVLAALPDMALTASERTWRDAAETELLAAARYDADQAASHLALGMYYHDRGQLPKAIDQYQTAIGVQPGVTGPRTNLSLLLEELGQTDKATALAREELRLIQRDVQYAPESAPVRYRFGLALYRDGQLAGAIEQLEQCVTLEPLMDHYWFVLAMLYERAGRWQDGAKAAERAVQIDPQNQQYRILQQRIDQGGAN